MCFRWSDGSVYGYANWASGYPSNDQLNLCTYTLSPYTGWTANNCFCKT